MSYHPREKRDLEEKYYYISAATFIFLLQGKDKRACHDVTVYGFIGHGLVVIVSNQRKNLASSNSPNQREKERCATNLVHIYMYSESPPPHVLVINLIVLI